MKSYLHRVGQVLSDVWTTWRGKGVGAGLLELKAKLWHRSCSILYMKHGGGPVVVPESIRIVTVTAAESQAALPDILSAGAGSDIRFFEDGAVCYLVFQDNHPVGLGWMFRDGKMVNRLSVIGYSLLGDLTNNQQPTTNNRAASGCAYLAGFHVIESARGRGLYPLLLTIMCRDAATEGLTCYVDVAPGNAASIRGIEKAGFCRLGELKTLSIAGIIIRCRITP